MHGLERLLLAPQAKTGSQNAVPFHDSLPSQPERSDIHFLSQFPDHLLDIYTGMQMIQTVEQHAFLHGRQRVAGFDTQLGHQFSLNWGKQTVGFASSNAALNSLAPHLT